MDDNYPQRQLVDSQRLYRPTGWSYRSLQEQSDTFCSYYEHPLHLYTENGWILTLITWLLLWLGYGRFCFSILSFNHHQLPPENCMMTWASWHTLAPSNNEFQPPLYPKILSLYHLCQPLFPWSMPWFCLHQYAIFFTIVFNNI